MISQEILEHLQNNKSSYWDQTSHWLSTKVSVLNEFVNYSLASVAEYELCCEWFMQSNYMSMAIKTLREKYLEASLLLESTGIYLSIMDNKGQ